MSIVVWAVIGHSRPWAGSRSTLLLAIAALGGGSSPSGTHPPRMRRQKGSRDKLKKDYFPDGGGVLVARHG